VWTDLKYRIPGRYLAAWGALVLLLVVVTFVAPVTFGGNSIRIVGALAGILALASFGQMLIIMLGAIDLSVPSILAVTAGIVVHFGVDGANVTLVTLGALAVAVVISLVNGVFIAVLGLNALIVTLATFGIVGGALSAWTGVSFSVNGQAPQALQAFGTWSVGNVNACLIVAILVGIGLAAALSRTRAGRQVAAVGANRRAARALGIRVTLVDLTTFGVAGLLYGIAGVLVSGLVGTPDVSIGAPYQLLTITAVAIAGVALSGGPASVATVLGACVFLQLLDQALVIIGLSAGARVVVQGLALVLAVAAITLGQHGANVTRSVALRAGSLTRR
jgi:ribose transport system permease protein